MSLIKCPKCKSQISELETNCPNCELPITEEMVLTFRSVERKKLGKRLNYKKFSQI